MYVLMLLGVVVTLITRYKKDAIISSILYVVIGHIITYPNGILLNIYIPDVEIPVTTSILTNMVDQLVGIIIPSTIAIIVTGIVSLAVSLILNHVKPTSKDDENKIIFTNNNNSNDIEDEQQQYTHYERHEFREEPLQNDDSKTYEKPSESSWKNLRGNKQRRTKIKQKINQDPISIYKKSKGEK